MLVCALNTKPGSISYMTLTSAGLNSVTTVTISDGQLPPQTWTATILPGRTDTRIDLKLVANRPSVVTAPPAPGPGPGPAPLPTTGNISITLTTGGTTPVPNEQAIDVPYVND